MALNRKRSYQINNIKINDVNYDDFNYNIETVEEVEDKIYPPGIDSVFNINLADPDKLASNE